MSQLVTLSNDTLLQNTKNLVTSERRIGSEIIHHLREIVRRDLHLKLGFNSLFSYMVEELKYSEGSAHRRIATLKLLDSIPVAEAKKVEEKINSGMMSLTTVAMVQDLAMQKKKLVKLQNTTAKEFTLNEKLAILKSIEGLSKKETEKVLIAAAPELAVPKEKERVLTSELTEVRIVLDEKTLAKLKRIKELRSHVNANPTYSELIDDMADLLLKKLDPQHKPQNLAEPKSDSASKFQLTTPSKTTFLAKPGRSNLSNKELQLLGSLNKLRSRYIPNKLHTQIWQRDYGRCSYKNPQTNKTCNSTHLLQLEHKIPFAKNGATTPENLTLLCRNHNQMRARADFNRR